MRFTPLLLPSRSGNLGVITLNNPKALNALTMDMIDSLNDVLDEWHDEASNLKAILIHAAATEGAKRPAFCAGGNVKSIYTDTVLEGGKGKLSSEFFRQEYKVNYKIATCQENIPQVAFWDGLVMGGGAGISVHGKYRVSTENTVFAMPETSIGFFPDVGSLWWMPRLLMPGTCRYLALTGTRLKAPDLLYSGIATHYVPSNKLQDLEKALVDATLEETTGDVVASVLMSYHEEPPTKPQDSFLAQHKRSINVAFESATTVEAIMDNLATLDNNEWAKETLDSLQKASPTSLKVTLEGLKRGGYTSSIGEDLQMEYRMSQAFMKEDSDFYRGIRATLVDKDGNPQWAPSKLQDVTDAMVESYFEPLGDDEWEIPNTTSSSSKL